MVYAGFQRYLVVELMWSGNAVSGSYRGRVVEEELS